MVPVNNTENTIRFSYKFIFRDGMERVFEVLLDARDLSLIQKPRDTYPAWTKLANHKCPDCPLSESDHDHCPTAASLVGLIDFCQGLQSIQNVTVVVQVPQRTYSQETTLQMGLSALAGIHMAAGCPVLAKLRPMVRFHLPFADPDETAYRVFSMYFLAQFFRARQGQPPDWEMVNLAETYRKIAAVNSAFCQRLLSTVTKDAALNAIVNLAAFGSFIGSCIDEDHLRSLEGFFTPYFEVAPVAPIPNATGLLRN